MIAFHSLPNGILFGAKKQKILNIKHPQKKLLLSSFVSVLSLSCVVPTYAIYEQELLAVARAGKPDSVISYVTQGANVNAKDEYGHTALIGAARSGNLELVQYLEEHGAELTNQPFTYFLCTY